MRPTPSATASSWSCRRSSPATSDHLKRRPAPTAATPGPAQLPPERGPRTPNSTKAPPKRGPRRERRRTVSGLTERGTRPLVPVGRHDVRTALPPLGEGAGPPAVPHLADELGEVRPGLGHRDLCHTVARDPNALVSSHGQSV